jgi:hypothetical protein
MACSLRQTTLISLLPTTNLRLLLAVFTGATAETDAVCLRMIADKINYSMPASDSHSQHLEAEHDMNIKEQLRLDAKYRTLTAATELPSDRCCIYVL